MPAPGDLLEGKYRLLRVLGSGGWGTVFEGQNTRTLKRVAIKVLHAEMGRRTEMVTRFEREAQAASHIGSEHIVEVYDLGELEDGTRYMVMEFLDGEPLSKRIQESPNHCLDAEAIALITVQVLEGLAAAHDAGILHRDLKPDNLFIIPSATGEEFVKLLDFGISKFVQSSSNMTVTGTVMGSPCYMSPEQARSGSKDLDIRSDIYSVGVVLFEALTGHLPYMADTFNELLFKIALEEPPDILTSLPTLDPGFAAIVKKAMAREAKARYSDAREFQTAIWAWLESKGHTRRAAQLVRKQRVSDASTTPTFPVPSAERESLVDSKERLPPSAELSDPLLPHVATMALPEAAVSARSPSGHTTRVEGRGGSDAPVPAIPSSSIIPNKTVSGVVVTAKPPSSKSKSLWAVGAAVVVALGAVGGFFALRARQIDPSASSSSAPLPETHVESPPSATLAATASAPPSEPVPSPSAAASAWAVPSVAPTLAAGKAPKTPKAQTPTSTTAAAAPSTASPAAATPSAAGSAKTVDGRRISTEL